MEIGSAAVRSFKTLAGALLVSLGVLSPIAIEAEGHVQLRPTRAPAGDTTAFRLVFENERSDAQTEALDILLPVGVAYDGSQRAARWSASARGRRLVLRRPANERLDPGEIRRLPVALALPNRAGDILVFKVLQRYSDGQTVRWIGPPDAVEPAPRVTLTEASTRESPSSASPDSSEPATPPAEGTGEVQDEEGGTDWLPVAGGLLGVGVVGLAAFALVRRRKNGATR